MKNIMQLLNLLKYISKKKIFGYFYDCFWLLVSGIFVSTVFQVWCHFWSCSFAKCILLKLILIVIFLIFLYKKAHIN
jgi:hypothetical protein